LIKVENVFGGYRDDFDIIKNINLEVKPGEFFTLIGPNGSGKTTLFNLITGEIPVTQGNIDLLGKPLSSYSSIEKAKLFAVLSQEERVEFDFTVKEIVSLGRYPHQTGFLKMNSGEDVHIVRQAMEIVGITSFQHKPFKFLSGGEKQRVLLAKAIAQQPSILFLDEPTNHLDMKHTFEMMSLLKGWQLTNQLTVLAILHDLNAASLFADRIGLMHEGQLVEIGDHTILEKENLLEDVYDVKVSSQAHPKIAKPQLFLSPKNNFYKQPEAFSNSYETNLDDQLIHISFQTPLRTISNAVLGEGIHWADQFCNFHVDKNYDSTTPIDDMKGWMEERNIPTTQAIGMMTAVTLDDGIFVKETIEPFSFFTMITAGTGNAVDITHEHSRIPVGVGTINIMVFIDGHLTDGALVNAIQSCTEAKAKALFDFKIKDSSTKTTATGTSTDSIVIAATQKGEVTTYAGSGTILGKGIGKLVYQGVMEALYKYFNRVEKRK
jgi:iron complex transport system ATP-binding protein